MSQANYIIICRGRIDVLSTTDPAQKLRYASACAAQLVSHVELTSQLPPVDAQAISDLQHAMMNVMPDVKKPEAEALVADMFTLLEALEDKTDG